MQNENNYKRLMILTVILLILVLGMSVYILIEKKIINFSFSSKTAQEQIPTDEEAKLQEMIDKTVFGKIIDINEKMITVEMTEPPIDANSQPKIVQKEIKIDTNTKFQRYETVENVEHSYQTVDAQVSDFKVDDYVSISLDKNSKETEVTAVNVDMIDLPKSENPTL